MTRETIRVGLGPRSYDIVIGPGALAEAGQRIAALGRGKRVIVIADARVAGLHGAALEASLAAAGITAETLTVPPGEATKSWEMLAALTDRLLAHGVERSDHLVAFGGGVIGDLAGFAAAILKRGCGLVQLPTSLLAQVDSSVGGKTGINITAGKNLVGAFHQPALVLVDPVCLDTLPPRQLRAGYAEIVKFALIADASFFAWLETNGAAVIAGEPEPRRRAIATAIAGKARIVEADERETSGRRAVLNLGHTFGHALETETGFSDRLLHGEAVAIGIALAFRFAAEHGLCSVEQADRATAHIGGIGLPVTLAAAGIDAGAPEIAAHMLHDKKARDGRVRLVLPRGIGDAFLHDGVSLDQVVEFLERERAAPSD